MKKYLPLLIGGILLLGSLLLCVQETRKTSELSFRIYSDAADSWETVQCISQSPGIYNVFLPSYATLDNVVVSLPFLVHADLNGEPLRSGMVCTPYEFDSEYPFYFKGIEGTLTFRQSSGTGSMFLHTPSGTMDKVDSDKTNRGYAQMDLYTAAGQADYSEPYYLMIKGRGNSSWYNQKKPYRIELSGDADLLNMDKNTGWILLSNADDYSGLRNKLILDYATNVAPFDGFSPSCEFVDLFLDGKYNGMYLLCERVENQPCVSGRILCRLGQYLKVDHPENAHRFENGLYLEIIIPEDPSEELKQDVFNLAGAFEEWINEPGEPDIIPDFIDRESFARKYLIEELFANTDATNDSQYFLIDLEQEKIFAGPCWDYDYSAGRITNAVKWWSPASLWAQRSLYSWCGALFRDPSFYSLVRELYYKEFLPEMEYLLSNAAPAMEDNYHDALQMNDIRWDRADGDYSESSTDYMKMMEFLSKRISFFNDYWSSDPDDYVRVEFAVPGTIVSNLIVCRNTPASEVIPSPQAMLLEETYRWYVGDDDEVFDYNTILTEDLTLYAYSPASISSGSGIPG